MMTWTVPAKTNFYLNDNNTLSPAGIQWDDLKPSETFYVTESYEPTVLIKPDGTSYTLANNGQGDTYAITGDTNVYCVEVNSNKTYSVYIMSNGQKGALLYSGTDTAGLRITNQSGYANGANARL